MRTIWLRAWMWFIFQVLCILSFFTSMWLCAFYKPEFWMLGLSFVLGWLMSLTVSGADLGTYLEKISAEEETYGRNGNKSSK